MVRSIPIRFNFIGLIANSGCVQNPDLHPGEKKAVFYDVPGRSRSRRNDCAVFSQKRVQHRGLAHVGLSDQHEGKSFSQDATLFVLFEGRVQRFYDLPAQFLHDGLIRRGLLLGFLRQVFGKI